MSSRWVFALFPLRKHHFESSAGGEVPVRFLLPALETGLGFKRWGTKIFDAHNFCEGKVVSLSIVCV